MTALATARNLVLALTALVGVFAAGARAATPLDEVVFSPDITVTVGSVTVAGGRLAADDLHGTFSAPAIGAIPAGVRVSAYAVAAGGDELISFDVPVDLSAMSAAPLTVRPGDIVRRHAAQYSLEFDAASHGVPAGVIADAVTMAGGGTLAISFDTTVTLDGKTFADEDLVGFDGSQRTYEFTGADAGVPAALDLDAAHYLSNGHLLLSFDGSGSVGGVAFTKRDVLEYDPAGNSWQKAYDGSAQGLPAGANLSASAYGLEVPTSTPTVTATSTLTPTSTPSETRTATATGTVSQTATLTSSSTPTPSATATATRTLASTATVTGTASPTPTASPTGTHSATVTATASPTATTTRTATATRTATVSVTATPTQTSTPPSTATHSATATNSATSAPDATGTASPTRTDTTTATPTPTSTLPSTATHSATATNTATPNATGTASSTATASVPAAGTETTTPTPSPTVTAGPACTADCNDDGWITIDELIRAIHIALGTESVGTCPSADPDDNGMVTIAELTASVNLALNGCAP